MMGKMGRGIAVMLAGCMILGAAGCGAQKDFEILENETDVKTDEQTTLVLYSPTAKGNETKEGGIMASMQLAMDEFEAEQSGVQIAYKSYTARNYQEKSYDDVCKERIRNSMGDDLYIMNPDVAYEMNQEGRLADLSDLDSVQYLTDTALNQCTVDGKVISVPMTMLCYGLFVNKDLLDQYGLEMPETTSEFLHCCEVLKSNGITPIGANRWWLENFVLTQGFASLYMEDGKEEKIAALNSGEVPISQYMRPGFSFLAELMEKQYFDVDFAKTAEAGDEKDMFMNQQVAFVIHYDTAIQKESYGGAEFTLAMIGFPTEEYGQVNLMNAAQRVCLNKESEQQELAMQFAEKLTSKEIVTNALINSGGFPPRTDIEFERPEILQTVYENVDAGRAIPGSNPEISLEQWGNTCIMVQELLDGKSVDQVMADYDALQMEKIGK